MEQDWDVIVVGAGIAGCLAATTVAMKSTDLRVLLLDPNPSSQVGKKNSQGWICGDVMGTQPLEYVSRKLGLIYRQPEIESVFSDIIIHSPDDQTGVDLKGGGIILDRPKFGRRLLEDALRAGVNFLENTRAIYLLTEDNRVSGVVCQRTRDKPDPPFKLKSRLVIDASGMSSKLRRSLQVPTFIEKEIDRDDIDVTARVNAALDYGVEINPANLNIYMDQEKAPGGYLWIFPKSRQKVNVGLGIQQRRSQRPLKALLEEWVNSTPLLKGMQPLSDDNNLTGTWYVSVRHQNDCLVANGYMMVGDAAWFPNPSSRGGIGPAVIGAIVAGETAVKALQEGNVSERDLWEYNTRYVDAYGKKTAGLEAFRVYLQSLSNKEINYGMRHFLGCVLEAVGIGPHADFRQRLVRVARGSGKLKVFGGLMYTIGRVAELNQLYRNYPNQPEKFLEWKLKVDRILGDVRRKFNYWWA